MASNALDYMVSIMIVTTLLVNSIFFTTQNLNQASLYQIDQQTSVRALNLLNNLLQNSGNPVDWGERSVQPTAFGLKTPLSESAIVSSFTPFRLLSTGREVTYTDEAYRNLSVNSLNLFLKRDEYVAYEKAAELLEIDDSYGFLITIQPALTLSISQLQANSLRLGVAIQSLSGTVSGASVNATLYSLRETIPYPSISAPIVSSTISDISGHAELEFPTINANDTLYIVLIRADLGGIRGVGYYTNSPSAPSVIVPFITNYDQGVITLAHGKNVTTNFPVEDDVYYNLTFIIQVGKTVFRTVNAVNSTGIVKVSAPRTTQLSTGNPGLLLISSRTTEGMYGFTIVPWGIAPLGLSMSYGADPVNRKTVAKKAQNVVISGVSYQVELALWRTAVEG